MYGIQYLIQRLCGKSKSGTPEETKKERVKSLDTFRGLVFNVFKQTFSICLPQRMHILSFLLVVT